MADGRFHSEVEDHARLAHPGVVYLFDYGEIDEHEAAASDGAFSAGSPYVAMELADGGTLRDRMPMDNWREVALAVEQVLDSLAFAHARGVVHRDLKPENLLVFRNTSGPEGEPRIKLADFGIAHAFGRERDAGTAELSAPAGTPAYMAPEQLHGQWRSYGPWTDLYAVGCIVWELVCGRVPFTGESLLELAVQHEEDERPALEPMVPVPEGLEAWIHRAMAVEPGDRFRTAADAAWSLPDFSNSSGGDRVSGDGRADGDGMDAATELPWETIDEGAAPTLAPLRHGEGPSAEIAPSGGSQSDELSTFEAAPTLVGPPDERQSRVDARPRPPVPETWRTARDRQLPTPLVGAGLELFGLREPPFVDRIRERDRLWSALRRVAETGESETILVTGAAGTGKSRLVDWTATRAAELGAANVCRVVHTAGSGGRGEGFAGMVRRLFHTWRLDRDEVYHHLLDALPPLGGDGDLREADARALTELLHPTDDETGPVDGPRYQFSESGQKWAVLRRLIERFARRRPVLLWLEDLQWGPSSLPAFDHLGPAANRAPSVLLVGTVRSGELADRPTLADRVAAADDEPRAERIDLPPLSVTDHHEFVERLLPLDRDLAHRLAERTEGNPLFAVQLLEDWIERDGIEVGSEGFRLASEAEFGVPDDVQHLWMERIERLAEGDPELGRETILESLELGATLGREFDRREWAVVLEQAGYGMRVSRILELVPDMIRRGLIGRGADDRIVAHRLLVDSLRTRARRAGRLGRHHRRCAEALEHMYAGYFEPVAGRLVEHWLEANVPERAVRYLKLQFEHLKGHEDGGRTDVLAQLGSVLDELGREADHEDRLDYDLLRCWERHERGDTVGAEQLARSVVERARPAGDGARAGEAAHVLAKCLRRDNRPDVARRWLERGLEWVDGAGAPKVEGNLHLVTAYLDSMSGRFEAALDHLERSRVCFEQIELREGAYWVQYWQGWVAMSRGQTEKATEAFRALTERASDDGYRRVANQALNGLGEIARFEGESDRARRYYRRRRKGVRELGKSEAIAVTDLNLAQVELDAGRFDRALRIVEQAERRLDQIGSHHRRHLVALIRLAHAAGTGGWETFDEIFARYAGGWPEEARLINDHPWLLELAADSCVDADRCERARRLLELAGDLWGRLGDDEAADRVADRLDG